MSLRETCSERKLFISDLLVASPEEGGQMLAGLLNTHFSERHGYTTIAGRTSEPETALRLGGEGQNTWAARRRPGCKAPS